MAPGPATPERTTEGGVRFDLHGYATDVAVDLAVTWVVEAWEHGCVSVTLVHGAAAAQRTPAGRPGASRGATKWALRDALRDGAFAPYAPRGSKHRIGPAELTLALGPCPDPDPDMPWTRPPPRDYP